ncbi:hypothetical protein ABBQ32_009204 [Trebouxia sp. C0010 RCD-2024]
MAVRFHRAKLGVAAAFLPVLNYVLLKFSRHIAHQLVSSGYESGKHVSASSSKAGASQASKGSRKSKAKSGLGRAPQPARVQRHSAAVSEADSAVEAAAATLQARLAPSAAQLANPDPSQNIDPNPWGAPAHAVGANSLQGRQAVLAHTSGVQPRSGMYDSDSAGAMRTATPHQAQQQQQRTVPRPSALPSRSQPRAGRVLEATQAWFMNPAFGGDSPLPSPEKQPRSQPPPQPHPSTCTGPAYPSGYSLPAQQGRQQASLSDAAASWSQASPAQHRAAESAGHAHELHHKQVRLNKPGMQWTASRAATPEAGQHQHPLGSEALEIAFQGLGEAAQWSGLAQASASQQLPAHPSQAVAGGPAQSMHHRHAFATQPACPPQQQTFLNEVDSAQHGYQGVPRSLAQQLPQHAQQGHSKSPPPAAHGSQQYQMQQQQDVAAQDSLQGQQHNQQGQQQWQQQEAGRVHSDDRMSRYVGQLQERLAEAEEQAAHARLEGDRRVQTLEARITLLEGRVRFVEGKGQLPVVAQFVCITGCTFLDPGHLLA